MEIKRLENLIAQKAGDLTRSIEGAKRLIADAEKNVSFGMLGQNLAARAVEISKDSAELSLLKLGLAEERMQQAAAEPKDPGVEEAQAKLEEKRATIASEPQQPAEEEVEDSAHAEHLSELAAG